MAAIRAHGYIWKDTEPGVWTAIVNLFGFSQVAHAVVVTQIDGEWLPDESEEARRHWGIYREASGTVDPEVVRIGDLDCVVYIA